MLKNILNLLIVLGYVRASLFEGLQDAKHAAKYNFNNAINSSPKLHIALDLPEDRVFDSIDYLIKNTIINKFEQTLDDIVEELIQVGFKSIRSINEVKLLVNEIYEKLKSLSNRKNDIIFYESESRGHNIEKVQEFFKLIRVGYSEYEFENIYSSENIMKPIKDEAYNVSKLIRNKFDELGRIRGNLDQFSQVYESSEEKLQIKGVSAILEDELIVQLDVNAVVKIVNEFDDVNHPLIDIIIETVKHRVLIVNEIDKHSVTENYYSGDQPKPEAILRKASCDLLEMVKKNESQKKMLDFIEKEVPEKFRNKYSTALISGGSAGLNYAVKSTCEANSYLMAIVFFELTDHLFPILKMSDYELQERIFLFIQWIDFVVRNGFEYSDRKLNNLHDSVQQLIKNLKGHNQKTIIDSLNLFKPYDKEFQGLFEDIEKELKKVLLIM